MLEDHREFLRATELLATGEFARCVQRMGSIGFAIAPDGIEVFQSEAEFIHDAVTRGAGGIRSMELQLLSQS